MLQLKPLKPAIREKKRYIVYQLAADKELNMFKAQQELIKELNSLLGVFDAAKAGIMPIKFDQESNTGILRVNHTAVEKIRACFVLISNLQKQQVQIVTKGVSGILKVAKEKYFEQK